MYNHPKISEVRKQWHSYEERYNPVSQSLLKSMTVKLKASTSSDLKSETNNTSLTASKGKYYNILVPDETSLLINQIQQYQSDKT